MLTFSDRKADPTDVAGLRWMLENLDPEGRLSFLGMRRVEIHLDALSLLPGCVSELIGAENPEARVLLVGDSTRIMRAGEDLKARVWEMLSEVYGGAERVILGSADRKLAADEEALREAEAAVTGADCVVVVGSGTVTDICKVAINRAGDASPLVVVQTAASVDGFSDDVSVILKSGVKRTIPSRWPEVLLADLRTIVEAPATMTAAGYGDAISMYTAPADWRLASMLGLDSSYHRAPVEMLLEGGPDVVGAAEGLGRLDPSSMEKLVRLLALRGIASGVSGSTAILSGAEHVVSHMLDMHAGQTGAATGIHGAQVGVATVVIAAAWQTLFRRLDPAGVDVEACFPQPDKMEPVVKEAFIGLDPSGAIGDECWDDYKQKLLRWNANRERFEAFLRGWPECRTELAGLVAPFGELARSLDLVGAPGRFGDLDPPMAADTVRWALLNCHFMRNRFNVVDLLYFLGWWTPGFVGELISHADAVGKSLGDRQERR
ncbi:iron-containing alcohol dehydrogenase [Rubrobacter indicoceani]|uniref:iron-containing alcohol dehydrogenase n=1 Tax=Rubrobacter indicoceani TaxID=2051957 RepID=UPI0013C40A1E|nr:iron-containing alcohol dehydrogenase [Rubrobacter indicoceani]